MPDLVINTGPVIALTAAVESLEFLQELYSEILIPFEVIQELQAESVNCAELVAVKNCPVIQAITDKIELPFLLHSQLDTGEASVIQNALVHQITTVVIDEKLGRRMARLNGLRVTGSIGILVRAFKAALIPDLNNCFNRMHEKGVWISETLKKQALDAVKLD